MSPTRAKGFFGASLVLEQDFGMIHSPTVNGAFVEVLGKERFLRIRTAGFAP